MASMGVSIGSIATNTGIAQCAVLPRQTLVASQRRATPQRASCRPRAMARMPDVSVHAQRIGIRAFSRVQPLPHSQRARVPRAYEPGRAETPSSLDRAIASLTFLVPLFDSLRYASFLIQRFPILARGLRPLAPLLQLYSSIPLGGTVVFFLIYLGVVQNKSMSRFVRANAYQAILLSMSLMVPSILESIVSVPTSGWAAQAYALATSAVSGSMMIVVTYSVVAALAGTVANIPVITKATHVHMGKRD